MDISRKWKKRISIIALLTAFVLMSNIVRSDTGWCDDHPMCPNVYASFCQCQSFQTGTECYVVPCGDVDNDGCYEPDYDSKIRCASGDCEQIGSNQAVCKSAPSLCSNECELSQTRCVGSILDAGGGTQYMQRCEVDDFGCRRWADETINCLPNHCNPQTKSCIPFTPVCNDRCYNGQSRCLYVDRQSYLDPCSDYNGDGCLEFYSQVNPQMIGISMTYCPFGCEDPQNDEHGVCMIEPEACESECQSGDTSCQGDYMLQCQWNSADNCYQYIVNGQSNNQSKWCEYGCSETTKNKAYCLLPNSVVPELIDSGRTYNCNPPTCGTPSHNNPFGLSRIGQYIYGYDMGDYPNIYRYFYDNLTYKDYVTLPMCNTTIGEYSWIAGDGDYLYALWILDGNAIISRISISSSLYCVDTLLNTSNDIQSFDVSDNYIWASTIDGKINKFYKSGTFVKSFSDNAWRQNAGGFSNLKVCGNDNFYWVSDGFSNKTWRYNENGIYANVTINKTMWDSCDVDGDNNIIYATDFSNIGFTVYGWDYLRKYAYGNSIQIDKCRQGDTKCAGDMNISGKWMHPYLIYCSDVNNDGYLEYPQTLFDGGNVVGVSCVYGCEFNYTLGQSACRLTPKSNCTNKDWKCPFKGAQKCENDWIWTCSDVYNDNCLTWKNDVRCDNGCSPSGGCKACNDECKLFETRCFNSGYNYINYQTKQSVWFDSPIIMNCTYDYNQMCYQWDNTHAERCIFGCFENFTDESNTTHAYCHTSSGGIEDEYGLLNYTESVKSLFTDVTSLFNVVFPVDIDRWGVFMAISIGLTSIVMVKTRSWKLGLFSLIGIVLFGGLIGWLPVWVTPLIIIFSGIFISIKLFGGDE